MKGLRRAVTMAILLWAVHMAASGGGCRTFYGRDAHSEDVRMNDTTGTPSTSAVCIYSCHVCSVSRSMLVCYSAVRQEAATASDITNFHTNRNFSIQRTTTTIPSMFMIVSEEHVLFQL